MKSLASIWLKMLLRDIDLLKKSRGVISDHPNERGSTPSHTLPPCAARFKPMTFNASRKQVLVEGYRYLLVPYRQLKCCPSAPPQTRTLGPDVMECNPTLHGAYGPSLNVPISGCQYMDLATFKRKNTTF